MAVREWEAPNDFLNNTISNGKNEFKLLENERIEACDPHLLLFISSRYTSQ